MTKFKVEEIPFSKAQLLPPAPNVCQECATDHLPAYPHNAESLYYKYKFLQEKGRWPTWADAMEHCEQGMKDFWNVKLKEHGVKL